MLGVISHDAGGAEVLSAYVKANPHKNVKYFLKGPAVKIFQKQGLVNDNYHYQGSLTKEFTQKNLSKPRFVAGSIGPTNKTASMSPDVSDPGFRAITFDKLVTSYTEQIQGLVDGGVDILLLETIFDTLNAKAALFAIDTFMEKNKLNLPLMVSGTITDQSGRTLSGQTVNAFMISVSHMPIFSIGFNCALGADQLMPYVKRLSDKSEFYTSAHPNAGLPNAFGAYDQTPEEMQKLIDNYLKDGIVNIIGGCCGTTEEHIKLIADSAKKYSPRKINLSN